MPAATKHRVTTMRNASIYHLEVVLNRNQVPDLATAAGAERCQSFRVLHAVIQVAMGWTNSHLHQFIIKDVICSDPAFELDELGEGPPILDENKITLMDIAPRGEGRVFFTNTLREIAVGATAV